MAIALVAIGLPAVLLAMAPERAESSLNLLTPALAVILLVLYAMAVLFSLKDQPDEGDDVEGPRWPVSRGLVILAVSTGGMIAISELLVGSIESFIEETGVSELFLGLILIPIFSNVVDHVVAISVALKNRMDLSLTISVGSAAQVACMVVPVVVLVGFGMGERVGMVFAPIELIVLAAGLALMVPVILDGFSNWLEGAQLLTCYLILAAVLWAF